MILAHSIRRELASVAMAMEEFNQGDVNALLDLARSLTVQKGDTVHAAAPLGAAPRTPTRPKAPAAPRREPKPAAWEPKAAFWRVAAPPPPVAAPVAAPASPDAHAEWLNDVEMKSQELRLLLARKTEHEREIELIDARVAAICYEVDMTQEEIFKYPQQQQQQQQHKRLFEAVESLAATPKPAAPAAPSEPLPIGQAMKVPRVAPPPPPLPPPPMPSASSTTGEKRERGERRGKHLEYWSSRKWSERQGWLEDFKEAFPTVMTSAEMEESRVARNNWDF